MQIDLISLMRYLPLFAVVWSLLVYCKCSLSKMRALSLANVVFMTLSMVGWLAVYREYTEESSKQATLEYLSAIIGWSHKIESLCSTLNLRSCKWDSGISWRFPGNVWLSFCVSPSSCPMNLYENMLKVFLMIYIWKERGRKTSSNQVFHK